MHERLDRADIDDPPLGRADLVEEGVGDVEHAVEIDRQDVVPVLGHGGGVAGDGIAPVDAGIVDQDRDVAALGDLGGGGLAGLPVGHVDLHGGRLAAGLGDELDGLASRLGIGHRARSPRAPFAGIGLADALPDARARRR
jgi:hypothetical protein